MYLSLHAKMEVKEEDSVRVIDNLDELIELQRNHGGCNEEMKKVCVEVKLHLCCIYRNQLTVRAICAHKTGQKKPITITRFSTLT